MTVPQSASVGSEHAPDPSEPRLHDLTVLLERQARLTRESAALLEMNRAISRHLDRDELFGALAASLQGLLPTDRFGIEMPMDGDRLRGHLLTPRGGRVEPTQPHELPATGTACHWVLENREWVVTGSREELRERFPRTFQVMQREGMQALCALPLVTDGHCRAVLFFMAAAARAYENLHRELLEQVAGAVAVALDHCLTHEEVRRLRDQLAAENVYLREEIRRDQGFDEIVGRSHALADLLREVEKVAPTHATVLIQGETGTGKELIARAIHERSGRRGRPLVKVNCAAIAAGLFESELFGHVKGAFTGALADRDGRFKLADGGTLFLDEIGELPLDTQVKLLRVLQEQEFEAIGSSQPVKVDVRVIAATNRDLGRAVSEGRFRADLFYRLNVFPMRVPPLRERAGDVPVLVAFFLQRLAKKLGKPVTRVSEESIRRLVRYSWPGNIRELQNVVERAAILAQGPELIVEESLLGGTAAPPEGPRSREMEEVERAHIHATLERTRWVVDGARGAARLLGLHPSTLRSRMKRLGVDRDRSGPATGST